MSFVVLFLLYNFFGYFNCEHALLIPLLRWKLQLEQGFKLFKMIQKEIYIQFISRLIIILTWHHFSYRHTTIHYNYKVIYIIKIQNSPL
jgi:hypothetical protein